MGIPLPFFNKNDSSAKKQVVKPVIASMSVALANRRRSLGDVLSTGRPPFQAAQAAQTAMTDNNGSLNWAIFFSSVRCV